MAQHFEEKRHRPAPVDPGGISICWATNYRMTDLQGVGQVQLAKLDGFIDERARWAWFYQRTAG